MVVEEFFQGLFNADWRKVRCYESLCHVANHLGEMVSTELQVSGLLALVPE